MGFVGSERGVEGGRFAGEMNGGLVFSPSGGGEVFPEHILESVDIVIRFLVT